MRAQFVLSEIGIGIRRNATMTIAVVLTVAISLALFGAGLLMRDQVSTMKGFWYDKVEVSVFLTPDVTAAQRTQLESDLQDMPLVQKVFYESKDDAYQRFQGQFKDSPDLVKNVSADALPESFRVKLSDPTKYEVVQSAVAGRPGVEQVQDQRKLLEPFFATLNKLQQSAFIVAIVQLIAAIILIANTIRVAAFSRRRETGIMRLVGASNLYIQLPFLLEGAFAGLIGAILAVPMLAAFKHFLVDQQLRQSLTFTPWIGWDAVWAVIPILLVAGVAMSALASFVTLRRYLRV